jgi:hypothetical protein
MTRSRRRIVWPLLAVLTLLVIGGCGLLGFTTCNPPDQAIVHIKRIPEDTTFIAVAFTTPTRQELIPWYAGAVLSPPFKIDPVKDGGFWPYQRDYSRTVWWRSGEKYGVVMQTKTGEWRVAWFPAADVPIQGRNWLGGEGRVEFDLSKAEIVPLDADTVKALGLQDVKPLK